MTLPVTYGYRHNISLQRAESERKERTKRLSKTTNKGKSEDGGSMDLRNVGILPQHNTVSRFKRTGIFIAVKS
jgi:hypothetical protein